MWRPRIVLMLVALGLKVRLDEDRGATVLQRSEERTERKHPTGGRAVKEIAQFSAK